LRLKTEYWFGFHSDVAPSPAVIRQCPTLPTQYHTPTKRQTDSQPA